jgi:5-methylcytosine-specific restriction enzyme subunit McrC
MPERLVFGDLVGLIEPDRSLSPEEDAWLSALVEELDPADFTVSVGSSCAATEPEPVLQRQLNGSWKAGRYIGELRREGRVLEIRPRLDIADIAAWAGAILNVRVVPRAAEQYGMSALIAELIAATWRVAVAQATRHGLPGLREPREREAPYARGRLDVSKTLRLRATRRPQVASVERPKVVDNAVSRVLVLADRVLDRRLARADWRGSRVAEVMPRLRAAVGSRPALPSRRELDRVRYTPMTLPYKRAAELSWQIAHNRGLRAAATAETTEGVLIDVAELWELFLVHCAKRAFGASMVTHGTQLREARYLLHSITYPGATLGRLYPDLIVGPLDTPAVIIDAKYKPLADPRGVDREDLYQLTSYLTAHPTSPQPLGMLAFTAFPGQAQFSAAEEHGPWHLPTGNHVRFERLPVTESACVRALKSFVLVAG